MTVAELLTASHAAHIQYRNAIKDRRTTDADDWLMTAATRRREAQDADPQHTDAAWRDESAKFPHDALMKFYDEHLVG